MYDIIVFSTHQHVKSPYVASCGLFSLSLEAKAVTLSCRRQDIDRSFSRVAETCEKSGRAFRTTFHESHSFHLP